LFDKYRAVDRTSFPWVSDALASSGRNRDLKKSPHGYKLGDLVEAAEIGIPGEVCSIREFYPGGENLNSYNLCSLWLKCFILCQTSLNRRSLRGEIIERE
jgi:hypothetical protein